MPAAIISAQAPKTTPPTCPVCGSLLSIVTWTCVRGGHCKPPPAKPDISSPYPRKANS